MPYFPPQSNRPDPNPNPNAYTELRIDNGNAATMFNDYVLRLDFGANGANINLEGTP